MIKCQICNVLLKHITASHLKKHDTTVKEYKKKYSVKYVMCKLMRKEISERDIGNDYGINSKRSLGCRWKLTKEQREKQKGNTNAKGYTDSKRHRESSSRRMIQLHKDGKSGCGYCKMYPIMNYTLGKDVKVQGELELRFAKLLNKMKIGWVRPKPKIYMLNGRKKNYFCDFWLPGEKYYIEVKDRYYYNKYKEMVLAKKQMMIKKGKRKGFRYKIMFEENIKFLEEQINFNKRRKRK